MTTSSQIEPLYVVDTNALIWYLTKRNLLTPRATQIFMVAEQGETRLYLSAITIAELYYANQKWRLFENFASVYQSLQVMPYFRIVDFRADEVLDFDRDMAISEMHDRIIIGVAQRLNAPIITSDQLIRNANLVRVEW